MIDLCLTKVDVISHNFYTSMGLFINQNCLYISVDWRTDGRDFSRTEILIEVNMRKI